MENQICKYRDNEVILLYPSKYINGYRTMNLVITKEGNYIAVCDDDLIGVVDDDWTK